jgi:16S rRNA (guanine527-N7)-methyltransferase
MPDAAPDPPQRALEDGAAALGLTLSERQLSQFRDYRALLAAGKRAFNLTALDDPLDVAIKHFVDALTILTVLPAGTARLIDVGTGAGFPGLPLKIARPELQVTLVEATAKKAEWVRRTAAALDLTGVDVLAARAEDLGRQPAYRGRYDAAVARALAPMAVVLELCLPFLRVGGYLIAQKTNVGVQNELPAAARALHVLGGEIRETHSVSLPQLPNRQLVVVEQRHLVPAEYPRRPGIPNKRPL